MKTKNIFHPHTIALAVALLYNLSASATDVGSPKGAFSVSPTGGSVYSVAIEAPIGIKEMQPNIAITYNSQSGSGIAGYGCSISGISVITRTPKDVAHDSTAVKGITFQNTDAFCLDGKRLLFQSGTEGAEGAVYTPEGEPFTEVILHTSTYESSPTVWFEVRSNNGVTRRYGNGISQSLYVYKSGTYYQNAWYISRVEDQMGNYMTYSYYHDQNFIYPSQIDYGYNNGGGGCPYIVNFTYEDEPYDQQSSYVKGVKVTKAKRLSNITTSLANITYRSYDFTYSSMTMGNRSFSALSSVTEKNGNNDELSPITYTWNSSSGYTQSVTHPIVTLAQSTSTVTIRSNSFFSADFNGDGFSDIVQISPVTVEASVSNIEDTFTYIYRSDFNKDTQTLSYLTPICYALGAFLDIEGISSKLSSPTILDMDGDGLDDIIIPFTKIIDYYGLKIAYYHYYLGKDIKSGNTTANYYFPLDMSSSELPLYSTSDIDNDGKTNIVILDKNKVNNAYNLSLIDYVGNHRISILDISMSLPSDPQEIFLSDFNNNGLNDLMVVYNGGYRIFWNQTGTGSTAPFSSSIYTQGTTVSHQSNLEIGDFNGDGSPDILIGTKDSNVWRIAYGNGDGTFTNQQAGTFDIYDQSTDKDDDKMRCLVYDFNGDGRSDVVIGKAVYSGSSFSQTKAMWLQSSGTGLTLVKTATSQKEDDGQASHYLLGDFSGNGRAELMNYGYNCYSGNNANVSPTLNLYSQSSFTAQSGKVTSITDGLGNNASITYGSLVNSGKYTPQSDAVFPMADVSLPLNVVTGTVQTNGAADNISLGYEYGGLKAHLRGRGLLGFSMTKTTDQATSDSTKTTLGNWDTQFFVPKSTSTTVFRGNASETSSSTVTVIAKGSGNYFAYPSSQTTTDMYGNATTLTRQFNTTYGYMTSEKVSNGTSMYKRTAYSNYIKKGLVWLPRTVTYTQKHADDSSVYTDVTTYIYNDSGLKTQETAHQNISGKTITTNYTYDTAGNVLSEVSSGTGVPDITRYYTYSSNKRDVTRTYTNPATTNIYYTYNNWGCLVKEQDRTNASNYLTTNYTYDGWGRRKSMTSPTGVVTNYSVGWGNSPSMKYYTYEKTQGRAAHYTWYDACGREVLDSIRGLKGVALSTTTTYDTKGRVSAVTNSTGQVSNTINYSYDAWDRVTTKGTSYNGTINYTYGNRTITSVKNSHTYTRTYDAWGNIKSSADPVSSVAYSYKSNGKPGSITSGGSTVTMGYDGVGNQTSLSDPDAGLTTYTYDAAGHLLTQTDARNNVTQTAYDNLGRISSVTVDGVATTYTYGTSGNEILRLTKEQRGNNSIQYTHDQYGRLTTEQRTVAGSDVLTFTYSYNSNDQISQITYPGSLSVSYTYDEYGCRTGMAVNGNNVWNVMSFSGSTLTTKLLNRSTNNYMDGANRVYAKMDGSRVLAYNYSILTGNLIARIGMAGDYVTENFTYDSLDRLTCATRPASSAASSAATIAFLDSIMGEDLSEVMQGYTEALERTDGTISGHANSVSSAQDPMIITYGANGNITSKTDIGNYYYPNSNAAHPHAVTSVSNSSALISTASQVITYNGFGKVSNINDNGYTMSLTYGPDQERWKTVLKQNGTTKRTTIYAGNYEMITENNGTREIYYLDDDVICMKVNHGLPVFYKGWTDNLGSYVQLIDDSGTSQFKARYDAWGCQEVTNNNVGFHRGYSGHEMLPEFGLINMNGRLYDPLLGRFLSPDNYVQLPNFSQSFNRYSYCLNNPLKYTDPSGEWAIIDDLIAMFVGGTINVISNAIEGNISSLEHGLWLFGSGALAGETALYSGPAAPFVSAGILGFGNSCINQYYNNGSINWDQVVLDVGMSEMMASFTSVVGGILPPIGDKISSNIKSPLLHDITKNTIDSSIGGASLGFLFGWAEEDADIGDALKSSAEGLGFGIVNGIISGTGSGFSRAFHEHTNPWTGRQIRYISKDVINNSTNHMHAQNRHSNLGISKDKINSKIVDLLERNYNLYEEGDNTFNIKVNGINKVIRVHMENGIITSFNFMNWNGNKLRSATPVRNLPEQWW